MGWLLKILEGLIIGIGIPFCICLLARLFPFKPQSPPKEPVAFDELKSKYNNLMVTSIIPFFAFWPYHVVHFSDGSSWSTINGLYEADQNPKLSYEKEREIFAFVAKKCGKEIERYDFLNKDEER
jgi:hypothetical protein